MGKLQNIVRHSKRHLVIWVVALLGLGGALSACDLKQELRHRVQSVKCHYSVFGNWFQRDFTSAFKVYEECFVDNDLIANPTIWPTDYVFHKVGSFSTAYVARSLALMGKPEEAMEMVIFHKSTNDEALLERYREHFADIYSHPFYHLYSWGKNDNDFVDYTKRFLAAGRDPNKLFRGIPTLANLSILRKYNLMKTMELLLQGGADPNLGVLLAKGHLNNLLPYGIIHKGWDEKVIRLLLEHGANPNQVRCHRKTNKGYDTLTGIRKGFIKSSPRIKRIEKVLEEYNPNPVGEISNCFKYQEKISNTKPKKPEL